MLGTTMNPIRRFISDDKGLVTIEWVAIAAVAFIAAIGIAGLLLNSADGLGGAVADQMSEAADDVSS